MQHSGVVGRVTFSLNRAVRSVYLYFAESVNKMYFFVPEKHKITVCWKVNEPECFDYYLKFPWVTFRGWRRPENQHFFYIVCLFI